MDNRENEKVRWNNEKGKREEMYVDVYNERSVRKLYMRGTQITQRCCLPFCDGCCDSV